MCVCVFECMSVSVCVCVCMCLMCGWHQVNNAHTGRHKLEEQIEPGTFGLRTGFYLREEGSKERKDSDRQRERQ